VAKGSIFAKRYKISGDKIETLTKDCPKCGAGYILAEHSNRNSCGKCGYSEIKKK